MKQAHLDIFNSSIQKLKRNEGDVQDLWNLYKCFHNGWGTESNQEMANYYLNAAAEYGSADAKLELERRNNESVMRLNMLQSEQNRFQAAKVKFDMEAGLEAAIKTEIIPALVSITTSCGITGTGFFQHSEWLVSNAHVISCEEALSSANLITHESITLSLKAEKSFHRPSNKNDAPDIVVINTNSRQENNNKCLPVRFTEDDAYEGRCLFYLDLNSSGSGDYQINYIQPRSKPHTYPIIYECVDDNIPQPGCLGTPIIKARVILDREPKWQFRVVAALYARCSPTWYNNNSGIVTEKANENTKLVCAIPIQQDFAQILQVNHSQQTANRYQQMASLSQLFNDTQGRENFQSYSQKNEEYNSNAKKQLADFKEGVTTLNIALPDGLEKLYYQGIVKIEDSLLIKKVLDSIVGRKNRDRFHKVPEVNIQALTNDFNQFIEQIKHKTEIVLKKGDNALLSPDRYFRIDIGKGSDKKSAWMLDIQDNTGKFNFEKKSLSSVFAKATIPCTYDSISGSDLAKLLSKSQEQKAAQDLASLNETANTSGPCKNKNNRK